MRPTLARRLKAEAEEAQKSETPLEDLTEYDKMLRLLNMAKFELKRIQSKERKAEQKRKNLPTFLPWIEQALTHGKGEQDTVLMTWQVWAIDCKEYHLALNIAEYAIFHDLSLPEGFNRSLATTLADEFSAQAEIIDESQYAYFLTYLNRVNTLTKNCDMIDEARAKLWKMIGLLQVNDDPKTALNALENAFKLSPKCGVKGMINRLKKRLGITSG